MEGGDSEVEELSKKEKGLVDMDNSAVIAWGRGQSGDLMVMEKNTIKIKSKIKTKKNTE